ncbi:MAG: hypothetical protein IKJ68_03620 [Clostridia bacterium]|nr:hypothetical protein [Clostridia bacterium]
MFKKLTSILLVAMLLATLTPSAIFAATTVETKVYGERAHVKGNAPNSVMSVSWNEINIRATGLNKDNDWYAFYKFDLSGLEDKIEKATKATLTLKSSNASTAFTVALLNDTCDNWSASTLTYNKANELGMLSNSSNSTNIQSGITLTANTEYTTANFADALRAAIADNPTNSTVTFRFYGDTSTHIIFKGSDNVKLNLEYDSEALSTDALFEAKKDTLAWDDITTQSIDNVTNDLKLPTKFYGFDLSWKSDNVAIDALTGKVTQSKSGDTTVNLTATIANGTATHNKTFIVTVPAPAKSSLVLDYADVAATRGKNMDGVTTEGWGWVYARKAGLNDENDRYIYYSFDLSGNEEKIMNASDVTLSFKPQSVSGGTWQLAILPETNYNWTKDTLTYAASNALGMMDDAIVIQNGAKATAANEFKSADFASALKQVLANNPANSVVTLRIYAETNTDTGFQRISPKLNINYYDMDLNSVEFFADVKDDLAWDDITTQAQDNVIADLNLPSKFYGYDVTWTSDDEAVSSSGEVEVSGEVNPVKLTATVSNGTNSFSKEFDIVVSSKLYGIDFSNAMGSGAKVYSAVGTTGVLVFAAYADSTLLSVAPVNVTLADGENLVNSLLKTNGATEVKIMLVSDMDTLTPLCTSKVK